MLADRLVALYLNNGVTSGNVLKGIEYNQVKLIAEVAITYESAKERVLYTSSCSLGPTLLGFGPA